MPRWPTGMGEMEGVTELGAVARDGGSQQSGSRAQEEDVEVGDSEMAYGEQRQQVVLVGLQHPIASLLVDGYCFDNYLRGVRVFRLSNETTKGNWKLDGPGVLDWT
ncbi:unnamed protein product [Linum trigynum]|uniref:Uncharacterized protein n=1 Tax=Linum trigynum TaxID=586398 RepID=A0AAV2EPR5_9ROSI